jgi:adenylosuccinate lyase
MPDHTVYESPFVTRYASKEMSYTFSPQYKHFLWRRLWLALAKAEKSLGLPITEPQLHQIETHLHDIDFARVQELEKILRHDVMAHIHALGEQCPDAKPILHLGATSTFVTDNAELIQIQDGLKILKPKLVEVIRHLTQFAEEHVNLACLSFTHLQAAQPTTVGKRACLWLQDFLTDLLDFEARLQDFKFLGVKGATGTQASFVELFNGDLDKVRKLDEAVAQEMGFTQLYTIAGQTYPRKQDERILSMLSGIAVSSHKFATDIRLLAHMKEIEEPIGESQIGSSAMPYKRNPMRCERVCGLARFLITIAENGAHTAANQWLERTLDDSANRRLTISEAFLCADAILNLLIDITAHLVVYPKMMQKHLDEELPFLASENILMAAVKKGKDRQAVHERLRLHSVAAGRLIKIEGKEGDFLERVAQDPGIGISEAELKKICHIDHFLGRAKEQVADYLSREVRPLLKRYKELKPYTPSIQI